MTSLLPPNASNLEKDVEAVIAKRHNALPMDARPVWDPDTCPVHMLPWLAWAMSVDVWDKDWPEHIKRGVINAAVQNHRIKGTRQAVENVVAGFGSNISITEWFEKNEPGVPHTFDALINYNGETIGVDLQEAVIRAIDRAKPVRSQYEVQSGVEVSSALNIGGAVRATYYQRLEFVEA
ncbi:phage tail protein I [Maricurvus nonylphenolicus]|uniref:phage tail protein I n=1 Tax=Maricurvus nonylphenolicus TaxID=1008307 RepID=UPI0036F3F5D7